MNICNTDARRIIKYLDDAAKVYDFLPGRRFACRAWVIRQLNKKLKTKLKKTNYQ